MPLTVLGLGDLVIDTERPCVGLGLNFLIREFGDDARKGEPSVGLILTDTGLVNGSCLGGTFSGGPIESSRLRFFFFSLLRSSPDLLDFLSDLIRSSIDLICEDVIGVIVMELGRAAGAAADMGMISIPGRRSRQSMDEMPAPDGGCGLAELLPMGVMLTDEGMYDLPSVKSSNKEEELLLISESLLLSFCLL